MTFLVDDEAPTFDSMLLCGYSERRPCVCRFGLIHTASHVLVLNWDQSQRSTLPSTERTISSRTPRRYITNNAQVSEYWLPGDRHNFKNKWGGWGGHRITERNPFPTESSSSTLSLQKNLFIGLIYHPRLSLQMLHLHIRGLGVLQIPKLVEGPAVMDLPQWNE